MKKYNNNIYEIMTKEREKLLSIVSSLKEKLESLQELELKDIEDKIKEEINKKLVELGIMEEFTAYIDSIKSLDQVIGKEAEKMNQKIYDEIQKLGQNINLEELQEKLSQFPEFKDINLTNLIDIQAILSKIKGIFGINEDASFSEIYEKEKEKVDNLLKELKEKIEDIKKEISELSDSIKLKIQAVKAEINEIKMGLKNLEPSFKLSIQSLKELYGGLKDVTLDINDKLQKSFYVIFDYIKELNVTGKAMDLIDKLPSLSEIQKSIIDIQNEILNVNYSELLSDQLDKIEGKLLELVPELSALNSIDVPLLFTKLANLPNELNSLILSLSDLKNTLENVVKIMAQNNPQISIPTDGLEMPDLSGLQELNRTIYLLLPLFNRVYNSMTSLLPMFSKTKLLSMISELQQKIGEFNLTEIATKYETELKDQFKKLNEEITKFIGENKDIQNMIAKAEEIKAIFGGLDTSNLEQDFNNYINSLKNIYSSIKEFTDPIDEKMKKLFYPIIEKIKNADYQAILDKLTQTPTLPQNIKDQIKQMQEAVQIQVKKIIDFFDDVDSKINIQQYQELFNDLKDKIENVLDKLSKENLLKQYEGIKQKINSNEVIIAFKAHFSSLKALLDPLKELAKADNEKMEKAVNDIIERINNFDIEEIEAKLKEMFENEMDKIENILHIEDNIKKIKEMFENKDIKEVLKEQKDIILEKFSDLQKKIEAEIDDCIKTVEEKLKLIKDLALEDSGIKAAFNEHIEALKKLALDLEDKENFEKYKASFEEIKNALYNVNSEELITALNSTLFQFKDDFFEQINTLPKLEKIIENMEQLLHLDKIKTAPELALNSFNDLFENIKLNLEKLKQNEKIAPIIQKIEEVKKKVEEEIKKFEGEIEKIEEAIKAKKDGLSGKVDEYVERLKLLQENMNNNIKEMVKKELFTCDSPFIEKLKEIGDIDNIFIKISDDFKNSELKKIIDDLKADSQKAKEEIKADIEKIKPKISEIQVKIQEKIKPYQDDPRFEPLLLVIGNFTDSLDKLKALLEKLKENESLKAFKEKIGDTKIDLGKIEEAIKSIQLKEVYYKLKDKVEGLDIKGKLTKLNEAKDKFLEERKKYKSLETKTQKIEYIFNSGKEIAKDQIEIIKKEIQEIKEKIKSLGGEELNDLIEEINKINSGITEKINIDEINSKIEDSLSKLGEFENQLKNFDEKKEGEKNQEALDDLKDKVNEIDVTAVLNYIDNIVVNELETANITYYIVKAILLEYMNKPDDKNVSDVTKNLTDIFKAKFEEFKISAQEAIKGTKLEEIVKGISESDELKDLLEKIEQLNKFAKEYEDKSPEEIRKGIIEAIKQSEMNKELQEKVDKLKEDCEKLIDAINKVNFATLKKINGKLAENVKEQKEKMEEYFGKIKGLSENLKKIYESKPFEKTREFINNLLDGIDFDLIISIMKDLKKVNVTQEVENAKRIKELTEEMNSIYESDPLVKIFMKVLKNKLRLLSQANKKNKGIIKTKKKFRKMQEKTGEITCKIDQKYASGTTLNIEKPTSIQSYILKQTTQFSLSFSSEIKLSIQTDTANCPASFVSTVKKNVNFRKHFNFNKEPSKGRLKFRIIFHIRRVRTFIIPRFFYLVLRVRIVRRSITVSRNLQNEEEQDSYCIPEDDNLSETNTEENPFNCFLYNDNISDIEALHGLTSDYADNLTDNITIYENNDTSQVSDSTDDGNKTTHNSGYGRKYFRDNSGRKLSAGAIVGIVIGSIAVVAIVLGLLMYLKGKASSQAPFQGNMTETQKNFQINNSVNLPIDA